MAITGQIAAWINLVILDAITLNNNVTLAILNEEKNMAILFRDSNNVLSYLIPRLFSLTLLLRCIDPQTGIFFALRHDASTDAALPEPMRPSQNQCVLDATNASTS